MATSSKSGRINGRWLAQGYLFVLLLAVAVLGSPFYALLAWALLAASLYFSFRPLNPRMALSYILAVFSLVPLGVASLADYPVSVGLVTPPGFAALAGLLGAPLLCLLDVQVKRYAKEMAFRPIREGSHLTTLSGALFAAVLAVTLAALVIGRLELLFSGAMLLGYLLTAVIIANRRLRRPVVEIPRVVVRVIAGNEAMVARSAVGLWGVELRARLSPRDKWLKVAPEIFHLDKTCGKEPLVVELAPPLSGPVYPVMALSTMDSRGMVQHDRDITPLELHVIPRAKYAGWLARKYLKEGGSVWTPFSLASLATGRTAEKKGSGDYYQSRDYQPGDLRRDIDWRHTLKLRHLVVKERIDVAERIAVLAVNLSVADAEAADKLAYNLITTALTLSREAVPAALVAYREEKVVLAMPLSDPRDVLNQSLKLVKDIKAPSGKRCFGLADIASLKRNITLLEKTGSPPAQRLRELLELESRAVENAAARHVATGAIFKVASRLAPPAAVIMLSELNHDSEALAVAGERLRKRGFATYFMTVDGHQPVQSP